MHRIQELPQLVTQELQQELSVAIGSESAMNLQACGLMHNDNALVLMEDRNHKPKIATALVGTALSRPLSKVFNPAGLEMDILSAWTSPN